MASYTFSELSVGMKAERTKIVTDADVQQFAEVSTDTNPVHLDDAYAAATMFKKRIAHGMLSCSLISAVLGNELPGEGAIYISQDVRFTKPVFIGDSITAIVEVIELDEKKKRAVLRTICVNQDDTEVVVGTAVLAPARR